MQDLRLCFEGTEDPRRSNAIRHDFKGMLMITLISTISSGETCADMAVCGRSKERFLCALMKVEHGILNHGAFSDLFGISQGLQTAFQAWGHVLASGQFSTRCWRILTNEISLLEISPEVGWNLQTKPFQILSKLISRPGSGDE